MNIKFFGLIVLLCTTSHQISAMMPKSNCLTSDNKKGHLFGDGCYENWPTSFYGS